MRENKVGNSLLKRILNINTSLYTSSLYNINSITQSIRGVRIFCEQFTPDFSPRKEILATMFGLFELFGLFIIVHNCLDVRIVRNVRIVHNVRNVRDGVYERNK